MTPHQVDRAEIITLVDNLSDQVMAGDERIERPKLLPGPDHRVNPLLAEHGFAALIRLFRGGEVREVLLDTGLTGRPLLHNAGQLGIDLGRVEEMVLSHGHFDHLGGLAALAGRLRSPVRVVAHPDATLRRFLKRPDGQLVAMPEFLTENFADTPLRFEFTAEPAFLAGGALLTTGQVARTTEFEFGFPVQYAEREGQLESDALMHDDMAVLFVVKGRGLVVLTGCGHAGVVNTVRHAMNLTGRDKVYAVLGGFHLQPPVSDETIRATVDELAALAPQVLMATHCTGFEAQARLRHALPEAFVLGTVGSTLRL
ncbi:MAG: MBL fold metallo-hydrolase [Proteobacteria bacterium]|nr:MBL fold metallo-hydrolase [Pseudomonadota bacterium]MBU1740088.1 MBL fold metallo-hydrolase [Pseudomonadota bacterium]